MAEAKWEDVGSVEELRQRPLQEVRVAGVALALGFVFPQFPFVAHSRGWEAEDMERNVEFVRESRELREGAAALAGRAVDLASRLLASVTPPEQISRGGRKAHHMA